MPIFRRRSDPLCLILCDYVFRYFCCCLGFTLLFWTLCSAFYFYSNVQLALFASAAHVHCSCMCVCVYTIILIWWSQIIKSPSFDSHSHLFFSSFFWIFIFFFFCFSAVHCTCKDLCHFLMCVLFFCFCLILPYVGRITFIFFFEIFCYIFIENELNSRKEF